MGTGCRRITTMPLSTRAEQPMLPDTLALVDDDAAFCEYLTQFLEGRGVKARWFGDSASLLADSGAFDFSFYILDLVLPGEDGLGLLQRIRQRSDAGVLVVTGKLSDDVFDQVLGNGADMHLSKPVTFEQILLAVTCVYRRSRRPAPRLGSWEVDERNGRLLSPDGVVIELSPTDRVVLCTLADAAGATVSRDLLTFRLGLAAEDDPNRLHAIIYRLRRRIERATAGLAPLQSKSRQGYVFRAPLRRLQAD